MRAPGGTRVVEMVGAPRQRGPGTEPKGGWAEASRARRQRPIQFPHLNSPRCRPPQRPIQRLSIHGLWHSRLKRRLPFAGHDRLRSATGLGVPPIVLMNSDSQRPTIHRLRQSRRQSVKRDAVFGCSPRVGAAGGSPSNTVPGSHSAVSGAGRTSAGQGVDGRNLRPAH